MLKRLDIVDVFLAVFLEINLYKIILYLLGFGERIFLLICYKEFGGKNE